MSVVVVTAFSLPEHRAEVVAAFEAAIARVHGEPGVELYALHEGPGRLVMIEKYESEQARSEHLHGAALADLRSALEGASSAAVWTRKSSHRTRPEPPRKARCDHGRKLAWLRTQEAGVVGHPRPGPPRAIELLPPIPAGHQPANWRKEHHAMSESLTYQTEGAPTRDQVHTLFAQTMGYVAATAGLFALGAYLGRNMTGGVGIVLFIAAFACLIGMQFAARRSQQLTVGLLGLFGLLTGLAVAPTVAYYGGMDPQALWQAGGATALFIAGFGAAGYATRRDLTPVARASFWALLALIVFGIVLIFVNIPGGALIYSVLGLVIFAGYTMFDFQRLRLSRDIRSAPLLAASIFLDILNVFLFFLQIFSREE